MSKKIAVIASVLHPLRQRHLLDWYQDIKAVYPTAQLFIGSKNAQVPEGVNFKINSKIEKLSYWLRGKNPHKNQPLLDFKPDLVHLLTSNAYPAIREAINPQTKLIVSYRGFDINVYPHLKSENLKETQDLFQRAHRLHFISDNLKNNALMLGADSDKSLIIYRSIPSDTEVIRNTSKKKVVTIVSVGRLVWEKGYIYALETMAHLKKINTNFKYLIVGEGVDEKMIQFHINRLELNNEVELLGAQPRERVKELLLESDIYFQPSVSEALSNSILEASYYGLPVVSSHIGGIPEVVVHEKTGYLLPVCQSELYAKAILTLIENEQLRLQMGKSGQEIIQTKFSRAQEIKKWVELYDSL